MTTQIDVIRHGEPVGGRRYRGHGVDDPLTEKGWQQMWDAVEDCSDWQHIATSPLSRCIDFAQRLSKKLKIGYSADERLKEIGFGSWEGLTPDEILARDAHALDHFYKDPIRNRPDGAEPLEAFSGLSDIRRTLGRSILVHRQPGCKSGPTAKPQSDRLTETDRVFLTVVMPACTFHSMETCWF